MKCGDCKELNKHFGLGEFQPRYCCNKYGTLHAEVDVCEGFPSEEEDFLLCAAKLYASHLLSDKEYRKIIRRVLDEE